MNTDPTFRFHMENNAAVLELGSSLGTLQGGVGMQFTYQPSELAIGLAEIGSQLERT